MKIILTAFFFVCFVSLSYLARRSKVSFLFFLQFFLLQQLILYDKIALREYSATVFNQLPNIKVKFGSCPRITARARRSKAALLQCRSVRVVYVNFSVILQCGCSRGCPKAGTRENNLHLRSQGPSVNTTLARVHAWKTRVGKAHKPVLV